MVRVAPLPFGTSVVLPWKSLNMPSLSLNMFPSTYLLVESGRALLPLKRLVMVETVALVLTNCVMVAYEFALFNTIALVEVFNI